MKNLLLLSAFFVISLTPFLSAQEAVANVDSTKKQKAPPQYELVYKGHYCHLSKEKMGDDVAFAITALPVEQSSSPGGKLSSLKPHIENATNFRTGDSLQSAIQFYKGDDATITLKCLVSPNNNKDPNEKKVEQDMMIETLMMTAQTTAVVSKEVKDIKNIVKGNNESSVSSKGTQSLKKKEETGSDIKTIPPPTNSGATVQVNMPVTVDPMRMVGATVSKGLDVLNFRKKSQESIIAQSNKTLEEEDRADLLKQGRQQKHGIRHHFSVVLEEKDKKDKVVRKYELFFELKLIQ